ncbi:hypothetical protein EYR40_002730 [Pleurotus pulmonarius]|nr:hypothetical protein EYR36_003241 [Pleurotus pulmonarius]KAF4581714.1 hypothetical protein EYR40_002730 [Pleurotus pulmonarius]KAF4582418.1 hypothetical protein EYR38_002538 [Pleurotus pulmonarius]
MAIVPDYSDDEISSDGQDMQISDEGESDAPMDDDAEVLDIERSSEEDEIQSAAAEEEDEEEPSPPPQPRLKIKIKFPAHSGSTPTTATPTPAPDDVGPSKASSRRGPSRDIDIESEDEDDETEYNPSGKPMTTRQAVLASVVDPSHVSLNEGSKKKKTLNETELALRREETARKRRNLTEKKLEDEKMETINRLLKKQTRPRGKKNALANVEDKTNAADDEAADPDAEPAEPPRAPTPPNTYRWISSSRNTNMQLSFSVPIAALPDPSEPPRPPNPSPAKCDVEGCSKSRKYRLVKNWNLGACGMDHLKALEVQKV